MPSQLPLPIEPAANMTRDDFLVAPGNARALAFLDSYPGWAAPAAALHGPAASGKSHLVQIWAAKAGAQIVRAADLVDVAPAGAVAVEDIDAAPGAGHEAALFALFERGGPLLLTGHAAPALWPVQLPDLASRYRAVLAFDLGAPDDALLMGLAVKLFADRQLIVPEAVVGRMIASLERQPGAIRDFVARADARALAEKRPVNLPLIRELLAETPSPS